MADLEISLLDLDAQASSIRTELQAAIAEVLDSHAYCLGPAVERFEASFAQSCEAKYTVGVNSGTSALHVALRALDIGPGDQVITTPMTFIATSWAISYVGATPVYVDVDPDTHNISPAAVAAAMTEETRLILPVHLHGNPCDMDALLSLADDNQVPLVEDAAQAHGATYRGSPAGTLGIMGAFSFYPGKNLGACGEAGAIVTDNRELAERAQSLRNHASVDKYHHDELGYNYRMEGIQAAVLGVKLKYLKKWTAQRRKIAVRYNELLENVPVGSVEETDNASSCYHHYMIRLEKRDQLQTYLAERGVGTGLYYPVPLHLQPCYEYLGYRKGDLPVAEAIANETLGLPIYPEMTEEQVHYVVDCIRDFFACR